MKYRSDPVGCKMCRGLNITHTVGEDGIWRFSPEMFAGDFSHQFAICLLCNEHLDTLPPRDRKRLNATPVMSRSYQGSRPECPRCARDFAEEQFREWAFKAECAIERDEEEREGDDV